MYLINYKLLEFLYSQCIYISGKSGILYTIYKLLNNAVIFIKYFETELKSTGINLEN